jgi:hypothetical protein
MQTAWNASVLPTLISYDNKISRQDWSRHGNSKEIHIKWLISATHTARSSCKWVALETHAGGCLYMCRLTSCCMQREHSPTQTAHLVAFCQQQRWRGNNKRAGLMHARTIVACNVHRMDFSFGASKEKAVTLYLICMCAAAASELHVSLAREGCVALFNYRTRSLFDDPRFIY